MIGRISSGRARAVRLHGALTGGLFMASLILTLMRSKATVAFAPPEIFILQCIALAFGASGFGAATVIRSRIPPVLAGADEDSWWHDQLARALLTWALTEGPSLAGAVLYFLTGSYLPLLVTVVGLLFLIINAPGRLTGR